MKKNMELECKTCQKPGDALWYKVIEGVSYLMLGAAFFLFAVFVFPNII